MLKEWIRNVPDELILRIVADVRAVQSPVWRLALAEKERRGLVG